MIFPSKAGGNSLDLAQRKAMVSGKIQGGLAVYPVPNSRLVRISIDATDPRWAATVVNAVADEYVNSNLERRYGATAYARKFLEEKLAETKIKLEESERALVAYQQPITEAAIAELGKPQAGPTLRQLLRRDLIAVERSPDDPKEVRYATTPRFLSLFGVQKLDDLPRPDELLYK